MPEQEEITGVPEQEDKQGLEIVGADLPSSVYQLRDLLADSGMLFDRGRILVKLVTDADGVMYAQEMKASGVIMAAHEVCQPYKVTIDKQGNRSEIPITLPHNAAQMYLEMGEWNLQPLLGISTTPIMREDGSLVTGQGYDLVSQMFCNCNIAVDVPERPSKKRAQVALLVLRDALKTFPFADAEMLQVGKIEVVDIEKPPGLYESTAIAAALTAISRASLWTAPGVLIGAPHLSGSGAGKGLLARTVAMIAFGAPPQAFPTGPDAAELDKRIGSALLTGASMVFLDNVNNRVLRSETLASALTERPSQVRILGHSTMLPLNCAAFIVLTGNGLKVAEDLARRFLWIFIDPKLDDPEAREFDPGFLNEIKARRNELLSAALTILRYGRINAGKLKRGLAMGSFEQWAEWVRDPLIALGCKDPVDGIRKAKAADPARQEISEMFTLWHQHHGESAVAARDLNEEIQKIINPRGLKKQFITRALQRMAGMRHAGFVLEESSESHRRGRWTPPTFVLKGGQREVPETPETPETYRAAQRSQEEPKGTRNPTRKVPETPRAFGASGEHNPSNINKTSNLGPETPNTPKRNTNNSAQENLVEKRDVADAKQGMQAPPAIARNILGVSGVSGPATKWDRVSLRNAVLYDARRDIERRTKESSDRYNDSSPAADDDDDC